MTRLLAFAISVSILLISTDQGLAQNIDVAGIFSGQGDDRSNTFFNLIFGGLFPGASANDRTVISLLIVSFNILFLTIAAGFLFYNIVRGTLDSAHEGYVLGQKSTIWVPIRILLAFALLIPLNNGYNGIQHGVSFVVRAGTATGTFFWNQTADLIIAEEVPIVGNDYIGTDAKFLQQLWRMEICRAAYNFEVGKGGNLALVSGGSWANLPAATTDSAINAYTPQILTYDTPTITAACGSVTLPSATPALKRIAPSANMGNIQNSFKTMINALRSQMAASADTVVQKISERTPIAGGDIPDLGAMMRTARVAHSAIVNPIVNPTALDQARRNEAGRTVSQTIQTIGSDGGGQLSAATAIAGDLKTGGWMMAGSYYMLISQISGDANAVAGLYPTATPGILISTVQSGGVQRTVASELGQSYWFQSNADRDAGKILANIGANYNASVNAWNEAATKAGLREFITERAYAGDDASSPENFLPPPNQMLSSINLLKPDNITTDPLIGVMAYGTFVFKYLALAIGLLSVAAAVPFIGNGALALTTSIGGLLSLGIAVSGFVGFILPYIPAVIWLVAVLAFILLVIEAVFAAPLWAVAMMSMEGDGIASNISRRGWALLLMLFLTPMLMVFGFLLGMIVFRVGAFSMNGMLFASLSSHMTSDPSAFGGVAVYLLQIVLMAFVAVVYLILMDWSFSLIHRFPARIFQWIDQMGDDLGAGTAQKAVAAGGALSYQGGQSASAIPSAAGGGRKMVGGAAKALKQLKRGK